MHGSSNTVNVRPSRDNRGKIALCFKDKIFDPRLKSEIHTYQVVQEITPHAFFAILDKLSYWHEMFCVHH